MLSPAIALHELDEWIKGQMNSKQLYSHIFKVGFNKVEPRYKNKMTVRPAKTQISLGISPVWSESSLSTWRKLGSLATQWAHSEDWSDWADAQADLSLHWAHILSWGGLIIIY